MTCLRNPTAFQEKGARAPRVRSLVKLFEFSKILLFYLLFKGLIFCCMLTSSQYILKKCTFDEFHQIVTYVMPSPPFTFNSCQSIVAETFVSFLTIHSWNCFFTWNLKSLPLYQSEIWRILIGTVRKPTIIDLYQSVMVEFRWIGQYRGCPTGYMPYIGFEVIVSTLFQVLAAGWIGR